MAVEPEYIYKVIFSNFMLYGVIYYFFLFLKNHIEYNLKKYFKLDF